MTIAVIFAEGFEEIEAITIVDVLRRAEFDVVMVGLDGISVIGAHDIEITMDTVMDAIEARQLDAVVLPGGMPGATNLANNDRLMTLLQQINKTAKPLGAICAAPIAFHAAGVMSGHRFTCYPSFEKGITNAEFTDERVTVDGNIITGKGPGAALEFSLKLVEHFGKPEVAENLREAMLVDA